MVVINSKHKNVKIEVQLHQDEKRNWTPKCKLTKPDGTTEELVADRSFTTQELAKDWSIEDARRVIDQRIGIATQY